LVFPEIDDLNGPEKCVAEGNRNREIADRPSISEERIKVHIKHVMEKLGATHRTQAVAIAASCGIIQLQ